MKRLLIAMAIICLSANVSYGASYWAKTFGAGNNSHEIESKILQTTDGGYITAGAIEYFEGDPMDIDSDVFVVKFNRNGDITWQKTYGGNDWDEATDIQETKDGGYILTGGSKSFGTGIYEVWILKLENNGNVTWQKTYQAGGNDYGRAIQQTVDGGYIVACNQSTSIWILKLESNGNVTWQKTYRVSANHGVSSIQQTIDGGYIIAGSTDDGQSDYDVSILKLAGNGDVSWQKTYEREGYRSSAREIQQTSDGGYIVAGKIADVQSYIDDIWVLKLNSTGNVDWQKTYGGSDYEEFPYIRQTLDGRYILSGSSKSFSSSFDAWIIKLESNGDVSWQKTYGWIDRDFAYHVQQTSDEGYIIAGSTDSFGGEFSDLFTLRIDKNGVIPDCNIIGTSNAIISNTSVVGQENSVTIASPTISITNTNVIPQNSSLQVITSCFYTDPDIDDDGVPDEQDNCPNNYNPLQEDADFSGIGDACNDSLDSDSDEWEEDFDNCPNTPNSSILGTCAKTAGGVIIGTGVSCSSVGDCEDDEYCQMNQGDVNTNGIGDVCECYADCNCDTKVNLTDLVLMKGEFFRDDCETNPCNADCNSDNQVNLSDLVIMKAQFFRSSCPMCAYLRCMEECESELELCLIDCEGWSPDSRYICNDNCVFDNSSNCIPACP